MDALQTDTDVKVWREHRALDLGCNLEAAAQVAREKIDLHRLADLIASGCPPDLAVRILAD